MASGDTPVELAQARAKARAALFGESTPGVRLGRYVLLHELGRGGMGVVHAAYDPELDRKIAIKLLSGHHHHDPEHARRLVREARALARLAHPHVVAVHDVGIISPDSMREEVFVAMEYVDGSTLRGWLGALPRTLRERLSVLEQAGEGLAAAHRVGLVHRDFKPDNVMVGHDGRARVMDFGLARWFTERSAAGPETNAIVSPIHFQPTSTGAVLGTPAYMAPEQYEGRSDARSDQFSFCVVVWEALYGARPFAGDTPARLAASMSQDKPRAPSGRTIPGWLRRVCERGLATDPQQRWPSMDALLEALEKGRRTARLRRGAAAVGLFALLGLGAAGHRRLELAQATTACLNEGSEIEAAWNEDRQRALRDGLLATEVHHAAVTADKVVALFDGAARAWRDAKIEACLETRVHARWNADTFARATWCLDDRRLQLHSLVDELVSADAQVVQRAVVAAAGLPAVDSCLDLDALAAAGSPPTEHREEIDAVRTMLARARASETSGRFEAGLASAREAMARAEAIAMPRLLASARLRLGALLLWTSDLEAAETTLEDAYFDASRTAAPEIVFEAALELVLVAVQTKQVEEGKRWGRLAEVALAHVSDPEHLDRASLLSAVADLHRINREFDEAEPRYREALELREAALGPDHVHLAIPLAGLANVYMERRDYVRAQALNERVLAIVENGLGPEHPNVAASLNNIARAAKNTRDYARAKPAYRRAFEIFERAFGPNHPNLAAALGNLGHVHKALGEYAEASAAYRRALQSAEASLPPGHADLAVHLTHLGNIRRVEGEFEEAKSLYERALAIQEQTLPADHPELAMTLNNLGVALNELGRHSEAVQVLERALASAELVRGPDNPELAGVLLNIANARLETGDLDDAQSLYRRALAILTGAPDERPDDLGHTLTGLARVSLRRARPGEAIEFAERAIVAYGPAPRPYLAEARFLLARALWDAPTDGGRDRPRALALAEQARVGHREAGKASLARLAEVEAWIIAHRD